MESPTSSTLSRRHDRLSDTTTVSPHADEKAPEGQPYRHADADADDLAALGLNHDQQLTRKFDNLSMLALAFCVLGTWSTFAQDLSQGLINGGPVNMLWGLCLVTACNLCVAASLGELCSSMPTTLGQAYWIHRLLDTRAGHLLSYFCAWINLLGWWTLTASQIGFMTQFLLGLKVIWNPDWDGFNTDWHQFLVYLGITCSLAAFNCLACRNDKILPWFNNFVGIWFVTLFFVVCLTLLITVGTKSALSFRPASWVFGGWLNYTTWSDGVVWFTGLLQAAYGLTAYDSVIHLVEELPAPRRNAPRVITLSVTFGAISGFIFLVICLFCVQDIDNLLIAYIPFMNLLDDAIGQTAATVVLALFIPFGLGAGVSTMTTTSRLTWAFARDHGIPFGGWLSHVNPTWKSPIRAIVLQGVIVMLPTMLYFISDQALLAILSVSTVALTISYGIPIAVLLIVGRSKMPPGGITLGRWGLLLNAVSVVYCVVTSVFFFFPGGPNPTVNTMNYGVVILAAVMLFALIFYGFKGRKAYLRGEGALNRLNEARQLEATATM